MGKKKMKYAYLVIISFWVYPACSYNGNDLENLRNQLTSKQKICAAGYDLTGAPLGKLNLENADFTNARLKGVDFSDSNLSGALFKNANASKAVFHRSRLIGADFTDANINGARFSKAYMPGIKYEGVAFSKGTIFEDKQAIMKKISHDDKIHHIESNFIYGKALPLAINPSLPLKNIHGFLYDKLREMVVEGKSYIVLDFRGFTFDNRSASNATPSSPRENPVFLARESLEFLRSPLFSISVKEVTEICDGYGLLVFLKRSAYDGNGTNHHPQSLDLHGKKPLKNKYELINHFIRRSHRQKAQAIEIITGRGLHNPKGKLGIMWNLCHQYLVNKKFKPYIQEIYPISKQGGWKVVMKHKKINKKRQNMLPKNP